MNPPMKRMAISIGSLVLLLFQGGCAPHQVATHWQGEDIIVNGCDNEWRGNPDYHDPDRQVTIRVTNDAEAIFLCIATGDDALKKQFGRTGLTVWLDPLGGKAQTFGIHLPVGGFERLHQGTQTGNLKPAGNGLQTPSPEPLKSLAITYQDTTESLAMTIDEVRRTGIDVAFGQAGGGRWVYEFIIGFKAAPCLSGLGPGMVVGVGIQSGESKHEGRKRPASAGQMGKGAPPGGKGGHGSGRGGGRGMNRGMNRDPGRSRSLDKGNPFEVRLEVQLAEHASG